MSTRFLIVFGKPGAGKSYIADILREAFGYTAHDGDNDIPADMKQALMEKLTITDDMRRRFLENMIASARILSNKHDNLVVHQTLLKEFMRQQFLNDFPFAQCILVECNDKIREDRYMKREYFNLGLPYLRHMTKLFEAPRIPHLTIYNNKEGTGKIEKFIRGNLSVSCSD
jgi:gluconate kinase